MNPRFNLSRVAAATATITLVAAPAWAADLTMTAPLHVPYQTPFVFRTI